MGAGTGIWIAAGRGIEVAGEYLQPEASAATTSAAQPVTPLPSTQLTVRRPNGDSTVFDQSDDQLLAPLAATPVVGVKLNHGGTSLSLRLEFRSGARAAFKPQQTHPQSDPRREIAAYRIDRMLGIGHVPPAKSATFAVADLIAAADPGLRAYTEQRLADEALARDGRARRRGVVVDSRDSRRLDRRAPRRRARGHGRMDAIPRGRRAGATRGRGAGRAALDDGRVRRADRQRRSLDRKQHEVLTRSPRAVLHGQHAVVLEFHARAHLEPDAAPPDLEVLAEARQRVCAR